MNDTPQTPGWITPFFYFAIIAFLLSVIYSLRGNSNGQDHMQSHSIADITINLTGEPVREHCTSCHPSGQPATTMRHEESHQAFHPDITPHLTEELGCTGCHFGEGMAVDQDVSHGLPGMGGRTVLKGKDVQASCFTCHPVEPLKGSEKALSGSKLFFSKGCDTCHFVDNLGLAGRYGPDLSVIGSYFGLKYIQDSISEPKLEPENSIMPRFPLSPSQVEKISYFLKSRIKNPAHTTPMMKKKAFLNKKPDPVEVSKLNGRALLDAKKCLACHKYQESDGRIAGDLSFIAKMRSREYLQRFIRNPQAVVPGAIMPVIPMEQEEEDKILDFLTSNLDPDIHKRDPKNLYMTLCQRCHAADGNGMGIISPNLSGMPRPFKDNRDFYRSIPDARIVESIEKGIPGTAMPPYKEILSSQEISDMIDVIFKWFVLMPRNEKSDPLPLPARPSETGITAATEKLFAKNCVRCHGKAGTGTGPEYLQHTPRPRDFTNDRFFGHIGDDRIAQSIYYGVPGTSMPAFRGVIPEEQLWNLVSKVRSFSTLRRNDEEQQ